MSPAAGVSYFQVALRKNQKANAKFSHAEHVEHSGAEGPCKSSGDSPQGAGTGEVLIEASKFSNFVSYDSIRHRASLLEDTIQRSIEGIRLDENRHLSFLGTCSNLAPFSAFSVRCGNHGRLLPDRSHLAPRTLPSSLRVSPSHS